MRLCQGQRARGLNHRLVDQWRYLLWHGIGTAANEMILMVAIVDDSHIAEECRFPLRRSGIILQYAIQAAIVFWRLLFLPISIQS